MKKIIAWTWIVAAVGAAVFFMARAMIESPLARGLIGVWVLLTFATWVTWRAIGAVLPDSEFKRFWTVKDQKKDADT